MRSGAGGFGLLVALLAVVLGAGAWGRATAAASNEAYATLLYGDEFLLGVRVLGKSIRDTGTGKDMVALVSDGVSDYTKRLLQVRRIGRSFCWGNLLDVRRLLIRLFLCCPVLV